MNTMIAQLDIPTQKLPVTTVEAILQRIRLRARRRIAWLRMVWSQQLTAGGEKGVSAVHAEIDGYLFGPDSPEAEYVWYAEEEEMTALNEDIARMEKLIDEHKESRLASLVHIFGLDEQETDLLEACLALSVEANLGRVYAYLQDDSGRPYVTAELASRLFGHGLYLTLGAGSPLKAWGLVTEHPAGPGGPPRLECDPFVRNWLLGVNEWGDNLSGKARMQPLLEPLAGWQVDEIVRLISRIMSGDPIPVIRCFVAGVEGSGRSTFAACVSRRLGLQLVTIDSDLISDERWPLVFMHAQRYAWLNKMAIAWKGVAAKTRSWSGAVLPYPLQFIIGENDEEISPAEGMVDIRAELPPLSLVERGRLWRMLLPESVAWPQQELTALIRRHSAVVGQIAVAAVKSVGSVEEASTALRESSRRRLGELAQQMTGEFTWDDLIVPAALRQSLQDFYFEAVERAVLWEHPGVKRLFPQGKGLFALFSGVPGTGKTMAAQVIANTLQLDLFRIDLSSVVSKYVGETSKNLERILSRAQRMDIVLLFDEADALFGKRTEIKDAHDRYANTDTNYLLQAIEQYPGIAILSSNKKNNVDEGFMRRLRYVMDFPKPDAVQRLALWRRISAELGGAEAAAKLDPGLRQLAVMAEITGAQIKFSLLSALFLATRAGSPLTMRYVLLGLEKEFLKDERQLPRQIKEHFS
jgi:hypothetical protein